jgi:hypothetical protein
MQDAVGDVLICFISILRSKIIAMKKNLLFLFSLVFCTVMYAQQPPATDSLKEYTGRYVFPEGSAVTEVNVTIENGSLYATAATGSSELRKLDKDIFEVVAYSGRAIFKRNADAKLSGVRIEIDDLILEGTKEDKTGQAGKATKEIHISFPANASNPR